MLSRIAESLFWIGRYVERADDTARILDVHTQRLVEDPWIHERRACANLLALMGSPTPEGEADTERVPVDDAAADSGEVETLPDGSLSIPVFEEEIDFGWDLKPFLLSVAGAVVLLLGLNALRRR